MRDKQLYTHLFEKEHTDFDECCFDAQRFDDNCEFLAHRLSHDASESSDTVRNADLQMITDLIVRKLRQDNRTSQAYRGYQQAAPLRQHTCDICHGDHPTKKCRVISPAKWCEYCRKMTNHESNECYYRPGYSRGQNNAQTSNQANQVDQMNMNSQERARPVLGT